MKFQFSLSVVLIFAIINSKLQEVLSKKTLKQLLADGEMDEFRKESLNIRSETRNIISEILDFDDQSGVGPMIREAHNLNDTMTEVVKNFLNKNFDEIIKHINDVDDRYSELNASWVTYKETPRNVKQFVGAFETLIAIATEVNNSYTETSSDDAMMALVKANEDFSLKLQNVQEVLGNLSSEESALLLSSLSKTGKISLLASQAAPVEGTPEIVAEETNPVMIEKAAIIEDLEKSFQELRTLAKNAEIKSLLEYSKRNEQLNAVRNAMEAKEPAPLISGKNFTLLDEKMQLLTEDISNINESNDFTKQIIEDLAGLENKINDYKSWPYIDSSEINNIKMEFDKVNDSFCQKYCEDKSIFPDLKEKLISL